MSAGLRDDVAAGLRIVPMRRRHLRAVVTIEEDVYPGPWSHMAFASELAQRPSRYYTVALLGPVLVGYAGAILVEDEGHVTTLTVDEAWQGHGVGTLLLLDLAHTAVDRGARRLTLEVRAANAGAQSLYRRFGFAPVGVRRNYYPETGEDAIVMQAEEVGTPAYAERLARIRRRLEGPS